MYGNRPIVPAQRQRNVIVYTITMATVTPTPQGAAAIGSHLKTTDDAGAPWTPPTAKPLTPPR